MDSMTKIELLIETIINGNSIKGCETYENMLKSITKNDIRSYVEFQYNKTLFGSKIEMLIQIADYISKR